MNNNKIIIVGLLSLFFAGNVFAVDSNTLQKQTKARLKALEKSLRDFNKISDKNCEGFQDITDSNNESIGSTITLKESVLIKITEQETELQMGDKIVYSNNALRKKGNKQVRIQYVLSVSGKKGHGYMTAQELKKLLEADNIIPKDCL